MYNLPQNMYPGRNLNRYLELQKEATTKAVSFVLLRNQTSRVFSLEE